MWNDLRTGLKWIAKACFALFLIAIALLPLLAMIELDGNVHQLRIPAALSEAWVALVLLALSLFLVYLAWRILRALVLRPFGSWDVFGASTGARLVALGITALFVPRAVEKLVLLPPTILFRLIESLGRRAGGLSEAVAARSDDALVNIQVPVMRLAVMVPNILSEAARILSQAFDGVLTAEMIIAIALWILIGNLLSAAGSDGRPAAGLSGNRLSRFVRSMTAAQRHGVVLGAVFLLGAYLSIAAIVAIPWLHEEKVSPGLTQESLMKMLNSILPAPSADAPVQGDTAVRDDPLAPLADYLSQEAKTKPLAPDAVAELQAAMRDAKDARDRARLRLQQMPREIAQRVTQMRQAAMNAFELETATLMSNQERGSFMRQIQQTITDDYRRLEGAQAQCAGAMSDADRQLREVGQVVVRVLDLDQAGAQAQAAAGLGSSQAQWFMARELRSTASRTDVILRQACDTFNLQNTVYTAPAAGTGWGPFGAVARWLLQTKSVPLTLITGMLGFGLLGSAIASFVRSGPAPSKASLTAEVTSVLVRGLSAAVVVFLAVKGGLAVFSSGDAEPNAYVVFLTCLVGAVFSEDVWAWARAKFLDNFQRRAGEPMRRKTMAEAIDETAAEENRQPDSPPAPPARHQGQEPG